MQDIIYLSKNISEFFNSKAEEASILTGFIKRKRKINGSSFIKAMVFGNLSNANCSIDSMCQLLNEDAIEITKQGLDFRFTEPAVKFMEKMCMESLSLFKRNLPLDCKILERFNVVKLLDSTYISLPDVMKNIYKGYGSRYRNRKSNTKSAIKFQLTFDYLNQVLDRLDLKSGVKADQGYRDYLKNINPNDLLIFDLGYFVPNVFKQIAAAKAYFISRYKSDTNIYDISTNRKIELLDCLASRTFLEKEVLLGKEAKLKVRIICKKLTPEQSAVRRNKANKLAKSRGYKSSQRNQRLLDWAIFVTNVPSDQLTAEQVSSIYKARWQIELLFKLCKSHIGIENLKGRSKSFRIMCELYAKLCVIFLFHGMISCIELKENTEISLTKAMLKLKRRARELFLAINSATKKIQLFIKNLASAWSKFSLKDRHRKKRLSTLNRMRLLAIKP